MRYLHLFWTIPFFVLCLICGVVLWLLLFAAALVDDWLSNGGQDEARG